MDEHCKFNLKDGEPVGNEECYYHHGLRIQLDKYKRALEEIAEGDCIYGDDCPIVGARHYRCVSCVAREALRKGV